MTEPIEILGGSTWFKKFLLMFAILLACSSAHAKPEMYQIVNASGDPLTGAKLTLITKPKGASFASGKVHSVATTDREGRCTIDVPFQFIEVHNFVVVHERRIYLPRSISYSGARTTRLLTVGQPLPLAAAESSKPSARLRHRSPNEIDVFWTRPSRAYQVLHVLGRSSIAGTSRAGLKPGYQLIGLLLGGDAVVVKPIE